MNEKQKTSLLIVCFLGALGLVAGLYYKYSLSGTQVKNNEREITRVSGEIDEAKSKLDELKAMMANKERVAQNRIAIEAITKRLPTSVDAPGFVNALVTVLRATGILQQSVRPSGQQVRSQYTEIPYTIRAFGRYHEIGQFLTLVEQNPDRFMRVKQIKLRNNLRRPSVHPMNIVITTFMFNSPPPPPKFEPIKVAEPGAAKGKKKPGAKK